ncbi:hypothetical protein CORC01_11059 [Colletotrichum orchidophilum]|uniref:Uncharacterized protein n=1 Tax=Colletotrichum orchidophilum TaxID=1209926 RepID=A0A1G4AX11_9PEZI|nr:uncharacterized protein CORC01_11059 [Colletotrichum orchidophilum]OHE93656.1 hypothetical protein CORC01_11059 [Colletotrichum orchidophilum]
MIALLGISQQDPRRLGESLWMSSRRTTTTAVSSWAEAEERASGGMMVFAGIALAAPARVPGVMGALPWDPSRLSPSTGRPGPGEKEKGSKLCQHRPRPWAAAATMDKDVGGVDQHELISFLDDTDTNADEFIPSSCSTPSSAPVAHSLIDEDEIDIDPSSTSAITTSTGDIIFNSNTTSFYSSARSSLSSSTTNLTFTTSASTTSTTTATMAPMTITIGYISTEGGDNAARSNGKTAATVETAAAGGRTSEDSVDWSHGLWNYLHHGLDGYSSPDLRLLQQHQQQHKQSSSSSSHHNLHLRPDSSRSHQHFHFSRASSDAGSRSGPGSTATATATANSSTTWTLWSGESHEKSGSSGSGSKKTVAATLSAANSVAMMPTKPTKLGMREPSMLSTATTLVPPPPVSPSGSFGTQMTKQEFEALPEAIQRKREGEKEAQTRPGESVKDTDEVGSADPRKTKRRVEALLHLLGFLSVEMR